MTNEEYINLWGDMEFYDTKALHIFNGQEMVETSSKGWVLIDVGDDAIKQIDNYNSVSKKKIISRLRRIKTHYLLENE